MHEPVLEGVGDVLGVINDLSGLCSDRTTVETADRLSEALRTKYRVTATTPSIEVWTPSVSFDGSDIIIQWLQTSNSGAFTNIQVEWRNGPLNIWYDGNDYLFRSGIQEDSVREFNAPVSCSEIQARIRLVDSQWIYSNVEPC
jgi:hypothetical protein